ncbi:MAG: 30S ribosomal protein S2 [Candidatus Aenigmarchaeota archaeon]|nr:30S ribosomal protein S2 [Candidatus Aenigmarchaeota archaeon]
MAFEQYLSAGMHIGMKQQTKDMKRFIYKIRDDGLAVLDLQTIDKRIKMTANFLKDYHKIMVVSRKGVGQKPAKMFADAVGAKSIIGRFLPGTITNPSFKGYYGPDVLVVSDPLVDKQAVAEAMKMRIPIVALVDTFNELTSLDLVIPVNNKGRRALATVYWMLAKELLKAKGTIKEDSEFKLRSEDFEVRDEKR